MTACIVGWSHLPFGKHEGREAESLVVEAASAALADAGYDEAIACAREYGLRLPSL